MRAWIDWNVFELMWLPEYVLFKSTLAFISFLQKFAYSFVSKVINYISGKTGVRWIYHKKSNVLYYDRDFRASHN